MQVSKRDFCNSLYKSKCVKNNCEEMENAKLFN